mgnify:CR=1 FL=1
MGYYKLGIDVGSTTIKVVALDSYNKVIYNDYRRHFSNIKNTSIPNSNELIIKSYNNNSLEPYLQYYNILNYDEIIENKKNIIIDLIDNIKQIDVGMPSSFINGQVESIRYIKDYYKILEINTKETKRRNNIEVLENIDEINDRISKIEENLNKISNEQKKEKNYVLFGILLNLILNIILMLIII